MNRSAAPQLAIAVAIVLAGIAAADFLIRQPGTSVAGMAWRASLILAVITLVLAWSWVAARRLGREMDSLREAEHKLRESEAKFSGILSIAAEAIITVDANRRIKHFNWGAEQIFGASAEAMFGRPLEDLLPERFRASHAGYVREFARAPEAARRMGHRREIFGLRATGHEFPAEASISKLEASGEILFTVVLRDITERKRAEEHQQVVADASALLGSSLEYEATLTNIVNAARPALADACILDVANGPSIHRTASTHRRPEAATALRHLETRHAPTWDSPSAVIDVLNSGKPVFMPVVDPEVRERRSSSPEAAKATEVLDARSAMIVPLAFAGRVLGALTLMRTGDGVTPYGAADLSTAMDIANRSALALEKARLYQQALRATQARDEVLGVVSHDLRNPLTAIAMCARVLRETPPESDAERNEMLDAVLASTDWMNRLIEDLLDIASIEAGRLSIERREESVEAIVGAAGRVVSGEARERQVTIVTALAPSLPKLYADAGRLSQVLANLLGNAVKFSPADTSVEVGADVSGGEVRFHVADRGPGIPESERQAIFERYWHARRGASRRGTGLGLAIARGIVEAHGGRIWVEGDVGAGSTFFFTVPVSLVG